MDFAETLHYVCSRIKPRRIIEFGSGQSTAIFSQYAKVTVVEYNPPGNWYGVEENENVEFAYVEHEDQAVCPHNLLHKFFSLALDADDHAKKDPLRIARFKTGQSPLWDLAYIDGAVHVKGFSMRDDQPGWVGGDLSYSARMALAGFCLAFSWFVLIDDVPYMPMLKDAAFQTIGDRFSLITRGAAPI